MKVKSKYKVHDYEEAVKKFAECKKLGTSYMTYDYPTHEYTIELEQESKSEAEFMRTILMGIKIMNSWSTEELDALAYADSAIKTLVDMGVLE